MLQQGDAGLAGSSCSVGAAPPDVVRAPCPWARPHLELPEDEVGVEVQLEGGDELQLLRDTSRAAATTAARWARSASRPAPSPVPAPPALTTAAVVSTQAVV